MINKYWPEFYQKYSDQVDNNYQKLLQKNLNNVSGSESRTFSDCYSDTLIGFMFIMKLNSNDEQVKNLATNMCNFYHEKTGIWMTHIEWFNQEIKDKYATEFYQKYKNTYPEELLSFIK